MASFNKVILLGNLTRDPVLRYLPNQTPVCDFGLAATRKFKTQGGEDREETCFVDCTAFGRTAEIINQYCKKGHMAFIEGRLRYETWEDKAGNKRSKLSVQVENVQLMPRTGGQQQDDAPPATRHPKVAAAPPQSPISDQQEFGPNEIPF